MRTSRRPLSTKEADYELRELTRRRKQLLNAGTAERNRLQKVLEEANVKIGSVLSDVFGVTGQAILEALLEGKASAEEMAHLARGLAKRKIPQLIEALRGHRLSDAHRFLIEHCLQHMGFLEQAIEQLEARIFQQINRANLTRPFELLQTIPAIKQAAAAAIVAEIGSSVDPFPSPKKLASWAGLCPGNNKSANKTLGTNCTKGNQWLSGEGGTAPATQGSSSPCGQITLLSRETLIKLSTFHSQLS